MRVIVLGAGVVGVVTAYWLARRGHAVTIIDEADRVAAGASFANAGQLSYSFTDALARPSFLNRLPSLLLDRDAAIRFRARPGGELLRWGCAFLRQCTAARARDNTVAVLELGMRSARLMNELLADVPLEFSRRSSGKLVLLSDDRELAAAREGVELKRLHGCHTEILARQEACRVEPALAHVECGFVAAIHAAGDEVGDARAFTTALAGWLERNTATEIQLNERVTSIVTDNGAVRGVTGRGTSAPADAVVVCLGCGSAPLLRPLRVPVAICPVRGYSVTLPSTEATPATSVTHLKHRIVVSRIGEEVRIAGFADFLDTRTANDAARIEALLQIARRVAPLAADYDADERQPWGGFRPMTPDSRPLVGPTRIPGLYLNTGHGMLGWTLACATGQAVAEAVGEA